jgi:hypothetical protein
VLPADDPIGSENLAGGSSIGLPADSCSSATRLPLLDDQSFQSAPNAVCIFIRSYRTCHKSNMHLPSLSHTLTLSMTMRTLMRWRGHFLVLGRTPLSPTFGAKQAFRWLTRTRPSLYVVRLSWRVRMHCSIPYNNWYTHPSLPISPYLWLDFVVADPRTLLTTCTLMLPLSCKSLPPCHLCRTYANQHRSQEGFGHGPMQSCYVLAARRLLDEQTEKKIWLERHGWLVPNLSPSDEGPHSPERLNEFRLAGAFAALYFLVMRQPMPRISPHVTLLLLCGSCPPPRV